MDHPHLRDRRPVAVALFAIVVMVISACSNSSSRALVGSTTTVSTTPVPTLPDRPPLLQPPPGFRIPDTRSAVLQKASGRASGPSIAVQGGRASVSGTVTGPDGPVAGATVLIERFVGTASGSVLVATDAGGGFGVSSVLGGRYRVRAWLQPSLATLDSPTGFVADGDHLTFQIGVERHDAVKLQLAPSVTALTVGVAAGVNGLLLRESVDGDGIIHTVGVAGSPIGLSAPGAITIDAPNPAVSGADGRVHWVITCRAAGSISVTATVAATDPAVPAVTASMVLPPCADPPATVPPTVPR
jgi:hypothetical protein